MTRHTHRRLGPATTVEDLQMVLIAISRIPLPMDEKKP
jgi:hypothetical protein